MKKAKAFPLEQIYREAHLAALGASWAEFEENPHATLAKYGQRDAVEIMARGFRPLLPVQVRIRRELEATWKKEGTWQEPAIRRQRSLSGRSGFLLPTLKTVYRTCRDRYYQPA